VRFVTGQDAFEISMAAYLNVASKQRNSAGSIVSYTDTTAFTWTTANG
jgi:hypothetical protein